jgi:hypothetical protein
LIGRFPDRVRSLDSETLIANPVDVLTQLSQFYGLGLDAATVDGIAAGDAFTRHSKGGRAFGASERKADQREGAAVHAEEIEKVTIWAEAVASSAGQALTLPSPLIG